VKANLGTGLLQTLVDGGFFWKSWLWPTLTDRPQTEAEVIEGLAPAIRNRRPQQLCSRKRDTNSPRASSSGETPKPRNVAGMLDDPGLICGGGGRQRSDGQKEKQRAGARSIERIFVGFQRRSVLKHP
jgi:hypothetical protein